MAGDVGLRRFVDGEGRCAYWCDCVAVGRLASAAETSGAIGAGVVMSGRVAVITGAGSGIGRIVALALSRRGYQLALAGRRPEPLAAVAEACIGEAIPIATDVCDATAVARLFGSAVERFGRVDLLFNNAGISIGG